MKSPSTFVMAGGGTGGHVIPALAVASELRRRGHTVYFVGTRQGLEAKLVPVAGFPIEWIEIGGLKRVGLAKMLRTLGQLPWSVWHVGRLFDRLQPGAVFSMGGYVAGPVTLVALWRRIPLVVMEPNAMPGFANRKIGHWVTRALLSYEEAAEYFAEGRTEVTGLPVREEFFALPPKPRTQTLTLLITGGSRGSQKLNRAAQESWPWFAKENVPIRFLHQTGTAMHTELAEALQRSGVEGEVVPFIADMPGAFGQADLVVCRSGAGAVAEVAAAGKPSILVPFPFSTDDHQLRNAEVFERAGAARLVADIDMNGRRLYEEVTYLAAQPDRLERMAAAARALAKPGAAQRAAAVLEEVAL